MTRADRIYRMMVQLVESKPESFEIPGWPNLQEETQLRIQAERIVDLKSANLV